jgi:hypothetical protein
MAKSGRIKHQAGLKYKGDKRPHVRIVFFAHQPGTANIHAQLRADTRLITWKGCIQVAFQVVG